MDEESLKNLDKMDFDKLSILSQECSKKLLFEFIDKKTTSESNLNEIKNCKLLVDEYKKRLMKKHDLQDLKPLEN